MAGSPFAPIPMPKDFGDAFTQGFNNSQNLFNSLNQNKARQQDFLLKQQAEARQQQILPHLLQQYKDAEQLAPYQKQLVQAQIRAAIQKTQTQQNLFPNNGAPTPAGMGVSAPQSSPMAAPINPPPGNTGANSFHTPDVSGSYAMENPNNPQGTDFSSSPNAPAQSQNMIQQLTQNPMMQNRINGGNAMQLPMQPPAQPIPQPSAAPAQPSAMPQQSLSGQPNEAKIISPGDPRKANQDQYPGSVIDGVKIPDLKIIKGDGYQDEVYPSGKTIRRITGPTELQKAQQTAQAQSDVKESAKNVDDATMLAKSLYTAKHLQDLIDKGVHTGWGSALENKFGFGTADQGDFQAGANDLQLSTVHNYSSRGSNAALGIVAKGKPSLWNGKNQNVGLVRGVATQNLAAFNQLKDRWETEHPGQKFPVKIPDLSNILNDDVRVQTPNGQFLKLKAKDAARLIKDHPDHKIVE
jgi:hypothetical protein